MPKLSSVIEQVSGAFRMVKGQDVDINAASDFNADIVDADIILVDDGPAGTQASTKKSTMGRLWTYISGKISSVFLVDEDNMSSNSAVKFPTQQSVKAYVDNEVAGVVDSAPGALNTLNELATALNDDANFSTTVTNSIALKAPINNPTFTGTIAVPNISNIETAIADNTSKNTNVSTNLSVANSTGARVIASSDGTDATIPVATTSVSGVMSTTIFDEHTANVAKNTNVSTDLGITGTTGARTITSSDGTDAVIPLATTSVSGLLSPGLFDEIDANTAKDTNATHTGDVTGSGALTIGNDKVTYAKMQNVTNARMLGNNAGSDGDVTEMTKENVLSFISVEDGADVTDTANVTSSGALMDSELTSIADVKGLDQSVVSGASPTFGTANLTDASNKRLMTDAQETKLDSVESSANNYVHPNHSGEVTSTAGGATVIANNVVDEANLKVSNDPTNGYVLTAQSGNNGGLTWVATTLSQVTGDRMTVEGSAGTTGGTSVVDSGSVHTITEGAAWIHTQDIGDKSGNDSLNLRLYSGQGEGTNFDRSQSSIPNDSTARQTGNVAVESGDLKNTGSGNSTTGEIALSSGSSMITSGVAESGSVIISSGSATSAGNTTSGNITIETGASITSAGNTTSGNITITQGASMSGSTYMMPGSLTLGNILGQTKIKGNVTQIGQSTASTGKVLQWDGSKAVWAASVGGSSTQVQYNQSGSFKGEAGFEYDESANTLSVNNISSTEFNTTYGGVHSSGSGSERALRLISANHVEVYLDSDQSSSANDSTFRIINGSGNTVWGVDETGNIVKDNPKIKKSDGTILQEFESDGTLNASTFRASGNSPGKFLGPTNDELSVESVDHLTFKIASGGASSKSFKFVNNTTEVASINSSGDLQIDGAFLTGDVTSSGNTATMAAVQTNITTITNASLKIGRDADNLIEFNSDNIIDFRVGAGDKIRLSMNQFRPSQNNVMSLGFGTVAFKNLFLGSGATINFNNSDVVLTHSSNLITLTGGNLDVPLLETNNITINGQQGTDGQVLTSTGSGVAWEDASGGGGGGTNTNIANTDLTLNAGRSLNVDDNNLEIKNGSTSYLNFDDSGISIFTASDDLDIGNFNFRAKSFTSDVATGTAPFVVSSSTAVANLQSSTTASIGNLTGEVTSTNRATVIADNIVDEANLKVSNAPTNGYVLTAQSGNTGGLTWAAQSGGGGSSSSIITQIFTIAYHSTSTSGFYITMSGASTNESTGLSTGSYHLILPCPFDGTIKRITSHHQNAVSSGTSKFELYIDGDDSDLVGDQRGSDLTVTNGYNVSGDATRAFTADCPSDWTFSKNETLAIKRTDSSGRGGATVSFVIEFDTST